MKTLLRLALISASIFASTIMTSCNKEEKEKEPQLTICMQYKNLEIESKVMGKTMKYNVLTPPSYDPTKEKYNVLYLLHGYGDDNTAWMESPQSRGGQPSLASQMFMAVKEGRISKTVVVMPDGLTSFYMGDWETYFHEELMPEVEQKYSIDGQRSRRVIAGLSMGGFGSAYHALKYADKFCAVYTMSMASSDDMFAYFANENRDNLPKIFVVNGDMDGTVGKAPEGFVAAMENIGITVEYDHWMGGHDWTFWGQCIPKFLDWFGTILQ